jgi:nucleotide-binding universal stress UspA family protein
MGGFEFGGVVMAESFSQRVPEAQKGLNEFLADELIGQKVSRFVLEGDPAQKIVDYAYTLAGEPDRDADARLWSFRRFLLGSVTAKVLHGDDLPGLDQRSQGKRL